MAFGRAKFGRKARSTLKKFHVKFYDLISKIHEKNPKKHTPPKTPHFGEKPTKNVAIKKKASDNS